MTVQVLIRLNMVEVNNKDTDQPVQMTRPPEKGAYWKTIFFISH